MLEELRRCWRVEEHAPGEQISYLDDECAYLFCIIEGCVSISWAGSLGEVQLLHLFWPGELVGDYAFITGDRRKVGCEARLNSTVAMISHSDMRRLAEREPDLWRSLAELNASRLMTSMAGAAALMLRDPRDRCIATMLRLAGQPTASDDRDRSFIPVSQDELARMANLSRNCVGSILGDLARGGHLTVQYRSIEIPSIAGLRTALGSRSKF